MRAVILMCLNARVWQPLADLGRVPPCMPRCTSVVYGFEVVA